MMIMIAIDPCYGSRRPRISPGIRGPRPGASETVEQRAQDEQEPGDHQRPEACRGRQAAGQVNDVEARQEADQPEDQRDDERHLLRSLRPESTASPRHRIILRFGQRSIERVLRLEARLYRIAGTAAKRLFRCATIFGPWAREFSMKMRSVQRPAWRVPAM